MGNRHLTHCLVPARVHVSSTMDLEGLQLAFTVGDKHLPVCRLLIVYLTAILELR